MSYLNTMSIFLSNDESVEPVNMTTHSKSWIWGCLRETLPKISCSKLGWPNVYRSISLSVFFFLIFSPSFCGTSRALRRPPCRFVSNPDNSCLRVTLFLSRKSWQTSAWDQGTRCCLSGLSPQHPMPSDSTQRNWAPSPVPVAKCQWRTWTYCCSVSFRLPPFHHYSETDLRHALGFKSLLNSLLSLSLSVQLRLRALLPAGWQLLRPQLRHSGRVSPGAQARWKTGSRRGRHRWEGNVLLDYSFIQNAQHCFSLSYVELD